MDLIDAVSDRLRANDGPLARLQGGRLVAGHPERVGPDRLHAREPLRVAEPLGEGQCLVHER
jgi:hypothetical protein